MPRLRILAGVFVRFSSMPLVFLPNDVEPATSLYLTRLTIADPEPDEGIFAHLSSTLTELCLREMPRHYVRRMQDNAYSARILTCTAAISIVASLCATNIRRLELVVREDDAEAELLAALARSCPALEYLELHRYARDDLAFIKQTESQVKVPTLAIANALIPLKRLRVLRLNLDTGVHVDQWRQATVDVHRYWHPFLEQQAALVARVLHWLHAVSFLTAQILCPTGWSTWELVPGRAELRYVRSSEYLDCDCTWL
ncbi:hypothetical protein AURDEDRAFT_116715 [Auricularia subglabra TFB-10046 SS5]|uniref:F-box domain-containing protein n=1 Tax=Auricularia subglabra (strain TFB-10046 / SS5) TaxID=717982 RepID=J0DAU2_AURST|nr:hypothetical protein AURDEDRAFT_116715 [Auricularia subglabra TFB-10046 SS5]